MAISFIYHTPIQHLRTLKDNVQLISKSLRFNVDGLVSYLTTVTMLLTVLLVVSVGSNYQIENVEAQSTNTSSFSELFEKGNSLGSLGKYEEAISWFDKALKVDPKNVDALYNKGVALDNLGRYEEAISWYDKALEVHSNDVNALNNKGTALHHLGRYEEAISWYDKALEIDHNDIDAIYNKGLALANLHKKQDALALLDNALTIDPTNQRVLDLKSRLQE